MRAFLYCLMGIAHLLAALAFAFVAMDNTGALLQTAGGLFWVGLGLLTEG